MIDLLDVLASAPRRTRKKMALHQRVWRAFSFVLRLAALVAVLLVLAHLLIGAYARA
jgi:hypothetical protein